MHRFLVNNILLSDIINVEIIFSHVVFDRLVRESKSFIATLAYLEGHLDESKVLDVVLLESLFQTEIWGGKFPACNIL